MSLVTEILDRLTGIAIVRAKLAKTTQRVETIGARPLDHEKRILRLEASTERPASAVPRPKRLPKK
jgi:hypothetical protein